MLLLLLIAFCVVLLLRPFTVGFHVHQKFVLQNAIQLISELVRIGLLFR